MSGDAKTDQRKCEHGWTYETLLAHIVAIIAANDRRYIEMFSAQGRVMEAASAASDKAVSAALLAQEKATITAFASAEKAVTKAEEAQQRVNIGQNEFRGQLKDQASQLASKESIQAIDQRVQVLEKLGAAVSGKNTITGPLWAIAGSVLTAVIIFILAKGFRTFLS